MTFRALRCRGITLAVTGLVVLALTDTGCAAPKTVTGTSAFADTGTPAPGEVLGLDETADRLQKDVAKVWRHMDRIWPGTDYAEHMLLVTDGKAAWSITPRGRNRVPLADLKRRNIAVPRAGGFTMTEWDGQHAVVVALEARDYARGLPDRDPSGMFPKNATSLLFDTATHEQFHAYVQHDGETTRWKALAKPLHGSDVTGRATYYPIRKEETLFRVLLYNSLLDAGRDEARRAGHLQAAAWWEQQLAKTLPEQHRALSRTDVLEGTANYVGKLAFVQANAGGSLDAARQAYFTSLKHITDPEKIQGDTGSYYVGLASLLLADHLGSGARVKQQSESSGQTPQQLLLKGIAPKRQSVPESLEARARAQARAANQQLGEVLDPLAQVYAEPSTVLLRLPAKAARSDFQSNGYYKADKLPFTVALGSTGSLSLKGGSLEVRETSVGFDGPDLVLMLDPATVRHEGDTLTVDADDAEGAFTVSASRSDGHRVFTARLAD
ncbi:hypothetical protein [Streptomyces sp. Je 1-332]|uniref:hypothetical protein n=1 Tax=Streptomyces sp. Je 1-332 TaxID=3231270 RepID=UPI00345AD343